MFKSKNDVCRLEISEVVFRLDIKPRDWGAVQHSTRTDKSSGHIRPTDYYERKETIYCLSLQLSLVSSYLSPPLRSSYVGPTLQHATSTPPLVSSVSCFLPLCALFLVYLALLRCVGSVWPASYSGCCSPLLPRSLYRFPPFKLQHLASLSFSTYEFDAMHFPKLSL